MHQRADVIAEVVASGPMRVRALTAKTGFTRQQCSNAVRYLLHNGRLVQLSRGFICVPGAEGGTLSFHRHPGTLLDGSLGVDAVHTNPNSVFDMGRMCFPDRAVFSIACEEDDEPLDQ